METLPLAVQTQSDADELIASRLQLIYKQFDGGLAEFFERLQQERSEKDSSFLALNERCFGLNEVGRCFEDSDSGDY
jgi:hypothetical protein